MTDRLLPLQGRKCPLPALKVRRALRRATPGTRLTVECTDPLAGIDIPNTVRESGDVLEETRQDGAVQVFVIRKR
jgi:tRNA 2-thiouridine synthesizing protein A